MIHPSMIGFPPKRATAVRLLLVALLTGFLMSAVPGLTGPAFGQDEQAPPPAASEGILLNFRDASLDAVLDYLSEVAGFVVVKDTAVQGRVSVVSRQPLTPEEAVALLNTVLKDRGYAAVRMGRTLKIVSLSDAKQANLPVRTGSDPSAIEASDQIVTQVIPLRFVDAVKLRDNIASLIPSYAELSANASSNALILTDTEANIKRVVEIVRALDTHLAAVADVRVFQLNYASATNAAKLINEVFKEEAPTQQQQMGPMGGFRRFQFPGGPEAPPAEEGQRSQKVTASADDRTNTVVVSGPPDVLTVVERVIHELDSNPAAEQAVFTCRLQNATAANLETVLNELFAVRTTTTGQAAGATAAPGARGRGAARAPAQQPGQQSSAAGQASTDLTGQVYVVADEDTNSLLVMTSSKNFDRVREIIAELDKPVPQVLIKVLIAEVTHTSERDLGVEFSALNLKDSGLGSSLFTDFDVAAQSGGLIYKLVEEDVTAALRVLEKVGKLEVLSRPYILASDNQEASITVGQEVPFIRDTRTTETGQTINTIQYEDIGIILHVTPHINPEGLVILDVVPEVSTLTGDTVPISETVSAPVFAKRSAESRVAVRDGQTIVIGGLMEDKKTQNVRKVPVLGDLPLLGSFFRRSIKETAKTELLIFLTPHVAHDASALQRMSEDEMGGSRVVPEAVGPGAFQRHMEGLQRGAAQPPDQKNESQH